MNAARDTIGQPLRGKLFYIGGLTKLDPPIDAMDLDVKEIRDLTLVLNRPPLLQITSEPVIDDFSIPS